MPLGRRTLIPLVLLTFALGGCGVLRDSQLTRAESFNDTDAAFVRAVVAHERTVETIARLGRDKAGRVELRGFAKKTLARQALTGRRLSSFDSALRGRRATTLGRQLRPPRFDPRALRRAVSFDHEFLVRLIEQDEYAVATAAVERVRGGNPNLRSLAKRTEETSRRDLQQLKHWLRTWYGDDTQRGAPPGMAPGPPPGGGGGTGGGGPSPQV
jgi:uncharacterized protein (DUF305 family)